MDLFRRRARTLAEVSGPTDVRLVGKVHAPAPRTSPFSGRRGAVFGWTFWVNRRRPTIPSTASVIDDTFDRDAPSPFDRPKLDLVTEIAWADGVTIVVEGRSVELPALGLDVAFAAEGHDPTPIDVAWPDWLPMPSALDAGAAYVTERVLLDGDEVELVATLEPAARGGAYRGGVTHDFTVRTSPDRPKLVERDDPTSIE